MNIERAEKILSLQLDWIKTADSKVSPLFAINIAMLGVLATLIQFFCFTLTLESICFLFATLLLALSTLFLIYTVFPRLAGPKGSNIYFEGISNQVESEFKSSFSMSIEDHYEQDLVSQIYRNAEIASLKFKKIKLSFILTFISLPFWLLSLYFLYK